MRETLLTLFIRRRGPEKLLSRRVWLNSLASLEMHHELININYAESNMQKISKERKS